MSVRSLESTLTLTADVTGLLAGLEAADKRVQALATGLIGAFQDPVLRAGYELTALGFEKIWAAFNAQEQRLHALATQYDPSTIVAAGRADISSLRADMAAAKFASKMATQEEELRAYEAETRKLEAEGGPGWGPSSAPGAAWRSLLELNAWTNRLGVEFNAATNSLVGYDPEGGSTSSTGSRFMGLHGDLANWIGSGLIEWDARSRGASDGQVEQLQRIYHWMTSQGGG